MIVNKKKILFIQHATALGGSAMSLLYTLQGIRKIEGDNFQLIIALAKWTDTLATFYSEQGFEVIRTEWIDTYEHTQGVHYNLINPVGLFREICQQINLRKARKRTRNLINHIKPDIVHLNSVVLFGSAMEISKMGVPLVWHVREPSVNGLIRFRTKKIIKALSKLPDKCIFICNADKKSWGNPKNGVVIYNFIDFGKFNIKEPKKLEFSYCEIEKTFNVLFLGGMSRLKGTIIIIRAFALFRELNPDKKIKLIFAGGKYNEPLYLFYRIASFVLHLFALGTYTQMVEKQIEKLNLEKDIIRLPFEKNVEKIFSYSDVLVFPAIRPHFARPIIEAGAMKIPVVASDIDGVKELVIDGYNGFLCPKNKFECIAYKLNELVNNKQLASQLGENGYKISHEKYNADINVQLITDLYNKII